MKEEDGGKWSSRQLRVGEKEGGGRGNMPSSWSKGLCMGWVGGESGQDRGNFGGQPIAWE